jgi:hypothetical protein
MPEQQMLIEYHGSISFSVISFLLNKLKEQMDAQGEKLATYKRILIIMVEVLENINKYIEFRNECKDCKVNFKLSRVDNTYLISAANYVTYEAQKVIKEKLDVINNLNPDDLKAMYRQIISNGQFTKEGGAGLGFIEMAKTSQHKIGYSFEKVDDTYVYYTINLELTS